MDTSTDAPGTYRQGPPHPDLRCTGMRYRRGALQFDGAVVFGLHARDATIGLSTGLTVILPGFGD